MEAARELCIAPESIMAEIAKSLNFTSRNTKGAEVYSATKLKLPVWVV